MIYYKFLKKINTILCFHLNEKIIISPLAQALGIAVIWLELPGSNYGHLSGPVKFIYRAAGRKTVIVNFSLAATIRLKKSGLSAGNMVQIHPGIKLKTYQHQQSIFDTLARKDHEKIHHKFFTVGTILEPDNHSGLECLFRAAGKTLNAIPNLQLVIVGDGSDNKNLNWLARQIGIANIVWLVGRQEYLKKWLLNFNVYVLTEAEPSLAHIIHLLRAMETGLPIVVPHSDVLEEYLSDNINALFTDSDNSDMLANRLIELKRNKLLRKRLGQSAQARLLEVFTLEQMIKRVIEIL